jgi:two-component system CheB/CheR fusion protein
VLDVAARPEALEARDLAIPETVQRAEELSALQLVETILRQSDTPPCAIINDASNLVYVHGRTGKFLEPAEGKATVNIVEMARPGLRKELAAAIRQVAANKQETVKRGLKVDHNGGRLFVNLTVRPILEQIAMRGLMMVLFEETTAPSKTKKKSPKPAASKRGGRSVEALEQELQYTRENLQTTIEELETSNEELKSTNEELQSTNEELQSTNEELETSKEELQSLNEESATVNAELQGRIDELSSIHDDMKNLLDSTDIATLFLDIDLRIRRFTPKATDIIPVTATDVGRPVAHLASSLIDTDIATSAAQVLRDLAVQVCEVESEDGRCYVMRVRPYRTAANVIDGAVITFEDITEIRALKRLAAVVMDSNDAITLQDFEGNITAWNRGAERMYGYSEAEAIKMNIRQLIPQEKRREALDVVQKLKTEKMHSFETQRLRKDGKLLNVLLTITTLSEHGKPIAVASTERDITNRRSTDRTDHDEG